MNVDFRPNRRFKMKYNKLFNKDPLGANVFLLLAELADKRGEVKVSDERELLELLAIRFDEPEAYQL